jgi:ribosomal protein L6P/L9E
MPRLLSNSLVINFSIKIDISFDRNSSLLSIIDKQSGSLLIRHHINQSVSVFINTDERAIHLSILNKNHRNNLNTSYKNITSSLKDIEFGYSKKINLCGVGFKCSYYKETGFIGLFLGFSHEIYVAVDPRIDISIDGNSITVRGFREEVGSFVGFVASKLRKYDPYKGKGVLVDGVSYARKVGKKV